MLFFFLMLISVSAFNVLNPLRIPKKFAVFELQKKNCLQATDGQEIDVTRAIDINDGKRTLKAGAGSEINKLIISTIEDRDVLPAARLMTLRKIIKEKKSLLNHVHAATMLQRCARYKLDITKAISLSALSEILVRDSHRKSLTAVETAHAVYGLRMLGPETIGIDQFLRQLTTLILNCDEPFRAQDIGNALYGMQKFSCDAIEVRELLAAIGMKFRQSSVQLNPQDISIAIYGLRKMNSECEEVLDIVEQLTVKTMECQGVFNNICVGNSLNGLQGMSSENPVVLSLLRALVTKVAKSPDELTPTTVGSALMGLRRMTTVSTEVRTLLAILALKINASKMVLNPVSFSMAFNGLRSMNESSIEMRALLGTLSDKTYRMSEGALTPSILSNALSGFRMMNCESAESKQALGSIFQKMGFISGEEKAAPRVLKHPAEGYFSSLDIGRALFGLQNVDVDKVPDVLPLLNRLASAIRTSRVPLTGRDAGLALHGLKSHSEETEEARLIIAAIASRLSLSKDVLNAKSISMAMTGLQGMTSESPAVCALLTELMNRIGDFDSQACGNVLFAMKKMSTDKVEVRNFLAALAPKIELCGEVMNSQELANAFYGLQGMDSTYPETRNIVRVLTQKLIESKDAVFTSQGIGNALSGFQSMSLEDGPQVAVALGSLADKLEGCTDVMSPYDLANALFGLQGISGESLDVRVLLNAYVTKMRQSDGVYSGRDIGYSLIGMSAMQPPMHDIVHEIFEELCVKVSRSEFKGQSNLLFMQFGKGIRVKRGTSPTLDNAKDLVNRKSRKEKNIRLE